MSVDTEAVHDPISYVDVPDSEEEYGGMFLSNLYWSGYQDQAKENFGFNYVEEDIYDKLIPLLKEQRLPEREDVVKLIEEAQDYFKSLPNVIEVNFDEGNNLNLFGDTHGQFYDVAANLEELGRPSEKNLFLFNGDFVDRGSFSVELVIALLSLMLRYPKYFFLLRGNHESREMTASFGFKAEVEEKYDVDLYFQFLTMFDYIPLAAIINKKVFVCHGGMFCEDGVTVEEIQKVDRTTDEGDSSKIVNGLLWSDPVEYCEGRKPSIRGCPDAVEFGHKVTEEFLLNNGFELLIRSHQMFEEGFNLMHSNMLITVFSAPDYCGQGNKGSILQLNHDCTYTFKQFSRVPQPHAKSFFPIPCTLS